MLQLHNQLHFHWLDLIFNVVLYQILNCIPNTQKVTSPAFPKLLLHLIVLVQMRDSFETLSPSLIVFFA